MKNFKKIRDVELEKDQLQKRKDELEIIIRNDWKNLKESLHPGNIFQQVQQSCSKEKTKSSLSSILFTGISRAIVKLFRKQK